MEIVKEICDAFQYINQSIEIAIQESNIVNKLNSDVFKILTIEDQENTLDYTQHYNFLDYPKFRCDYFPKFKIDFFEIYRKQDISKMKFIGKQLNFLNIKSQKLINPILRKIDFVEDNIEFSSTKNIRRREQPIRGYLSDFIDIIILLNNPDMHYYSYKFNMNYDILYHFIGIEIPEIQQIINQHSNRVLCNLQLYEITHVPYFSLFEFQNIYIREYLAGRIIRMLHTIPVQTTENEFDINLYNFIRSILLQFADRVYDMFVFSEILQYEINRIKNNSKYISILNNILSDQIMKFSFSRSIIPSIGEKGITGTTRKLHSKYDGCHIFIFNTIDEHEDVPDITYLLNETTIDFRYFFM